MDDGERWGKMVLWFQWVSGSVNFCFRVQSTEITMVNKGEGGFVSKWTMEEEGFRWVNEWWFWVFGCVTIVWRWVMSPWRDGVFGSIYLGFLGFNQFEVLKGREEDTVSRVSEEWANKEKKLNTLQFFLKLINLLIVTYL
jgi:hypothetical protein